MELLKRLQRYFTNRRIRKIFESRFGKKASHEIRLFSDGSLHFACDPVDTDEDAIEILQKAIDILQASKTPYRFNDSQRAFH